MPLRAILDDENIQSFRYSDEAWKTLKSSYKDRTLTMPCCAKKAIPKTSKLGTQYFAHIRKGECTSAPETRDHLFLKFLAAKIAQECGWSVTTERHGETPSGEKWIADVFCEKGKAKLAIEIQWSNQTLDEYQRRTRKYTESGVRVIWLYRTRHSGGDFDHQAYELPYFGFTKIEDSYAINKFNTPVDVFIRGFLNKKLKWEPATIKYPIAHANYTITDCWKCYQDTNMIVSVSVFNTQYKLVEYLSFTDEEAAEWVYNNISKQTISEHGIGEIKKRYSKTVGGAYISNGCIHCGAIQGNFFIDHEINTMLDNDDFLKDGDYIAHQWTQSTGNTYITGQWEFGDKSTYISTVQL